MIESAKDFDRRFSQRLEACLEEPTFDRVRSLVDSEGLDRLRRFAQLLVTANAQVNLTAIVEPEDVAIKHVADSLLAFTICDWPMGARVCDVGTGGGVPGIVLACVRPDLRVTLVDSVNKKLRIAADISAAVGVPVETLHARAEELGHRPGFRESFEIVTARAVARLPVLLELCLPLCRVGGCFVALKGPEVESEIDESSLALRSLGGSLASVNEFVLPFGVGSRTVLGVNKSAQTPGLYPRSAGIPSKRPLIG